MHTLGIVNSRNLVFLQTGVHSGALDDLPGGAVATRICQYDIFIFLFSQDPGKSAHYYRMGNHRFFYFCFFQKIGLQKDFFFFIYKRFQTTKLIQTDFQEGIYFFLIIIVAGQYDYFTFLIHEFTFLQIQRIQNITPDLAPSFYSLILPHGQPEVLSSQAKYMPVPQTVHPHPS